MTIDILILIYSQRFLNHLLTIVMSFQCNLKIMRDIVYQGYLFAPVDFRGYYMHILLVEFYNLFCFVILCSQ